MAAAFPFTVSTTGRLVLLSCFMKSPDRRRNVVSDWMSFVMSIMGPLLARLSQTRTSFSYAEGCTSGCDALELLDERSAGIQRPRSKILTDLRCSADSSGASITVARRPRSFVRTRTKVAFTSESVFIMLWADFLVPSVRRTRLTNVKPITVAKVCNRKELSAHWCEGPQGATPPFFARRNSSSTFHWPRKACTIRPLLQL